MRKGHNATTLPGVSVVIPCFNAATTIERTLWSALNQTYRNLEIVVVDDSSTDNSVSIVENIAAQDSRVAIYRQPNGGVAAARNLGIARSHCEYIAPLDADDLWHPTKIEKQVAVLKAADGKVGLVYCHFRRVDEIDLVLKGWNTDAPIGDVFSSLILSNFIGNASSPLIRRSCIEAVGGYDPMLRARDAEGCEDLALYLAIAERWYFALVPEYLVGYRVLHGSMSQNHARMAKSWHLVIAKAYARHPELPSKLFRWSFGMCYRWLGLSCLWQGKGWWAIKYLAKAVATDPSDTLSLWMSHACLAIAARPLITKLRKSRLLQHARIPLQRRCVKSSVLGKPYFCLDPTTSERIQARPRDRLRRLFASSIPVARGRGARNESDVTCIFNSFTP
jgi:glycosyltransferase involved in cell wall biosynthesis